MRCPTLAELPAPPLGKSGWPWTIESPQIAMAPGGGKLPLISIVTPSFNQGAYIEETIRSVLLQGYPSIEYVVMDGGSTDETLEIIKKYQRWLSHWESGPDGGQSRAINQGMLKVSGEIAAYLNSDDVYEMGTLTYVGSMFAKKPFGMIFGRNNLHLADRSRKNSIRRKFLRMPMPLLVGGRGLSYEIGQESTFWIRKPSDRFNEDLKFCLDVEFFIRKVRGQRVVLTGRRLGYFRIHPDSKTTTLKSVQTEEAKKIGVLHKKDISGTLPIRLKSGWILASYFLWGVLKTLVAGDAATFTYRHPR